VIGPNGSYLTAWCHLREDDRIFRLDRITRADPVPAPPHPVRVAPEPVVDGHRTRLPASALRGEDRLQTPT
jgi:predicted DNA-binding transcriptional regulator YafY